MEKDLVYIPSITTSECFGCKETFKLYDIQKFGMDFCKFCNKNKKFYELITIPVLFKKIIEFAKQENEKIENRLVVDISRLFEELQKDNDE